MTKSSRKFDDLFTTKSTVFILKQTETSDLTFALAVANYETQVLS